MKVILLERVGRTGSIGDEVSVKDGFARNFLLPQGKALRAAAGIAEGLNGREVVIIRQAGETGQLYGSVASRDVVEALAADGFTVQRSQVDLADPIKSVGVHTVALNLHAEVAVSITVNVARSEDEAARQSAGEDVTVTVYEDDAEGDFAAGQKDAAQDDRFEE